MPKAPEPKDPRLEAALIARAEFENGFSRSRNGNLWRTFEEMTITVFKRKGHGFAWCINDEEYGTRFSTGGFEDESDAIAAVAFDLGVGQ